MVLPTQVATIQKMLHMTKTWVNITTSIHPSQLVDMEGTAVVSYDVTSLADALGSTDINVMMTHGTVAGGMNATVYDTTAASGSRQSNLS